MLTHQRPSYKTLLITPRRKLPSAGVRGYDHGILDYRLQTVDFRLQTGGAGRYRGYSSSSSSHKSALLLRL